MPDKTQFETKVVHAGVVPDPSTGAIMTPIYATSTYVQESPGRHKGYEYSRTQNPTRRALESALAELEGAKHGFALSSGCTGTDIVLHLLDAGDHVVCVDDVYGGTGRLMRTVWKRHGLDFTFADLASKPVSAFATPKTRLVWIETPTNPMLKLIDIEAVTRWAKAQNPRPWVVVDNTFASPYFQAPFEWGADIVLHSTTKYLGGHSDVVGGALIVSEDELAKKIHHVQNSMGGVAGPFDSFLVLRGIKTLAIRMKQHEINALQVARFLESHPKVEKVIFPGLESHPQHALAKKQMRGFGGMITLYLKGGIEESRRFLEGVKVFALAESLGGVESLVEHPAIMTHASVPAEMRKTLGILDNLVRLSVGIENAADLVKDLDSALKKI